MSRSRGYILVVEDDPALLVMLRRIVADAVADAPRHVEGVETAAHAAAAMRARPPDLVLLDMRLPDLHGLTLLRSMRATPGLQRVPVVIHTATPEGDLRGLEAEVVLRKPTLPSALRAAVRKALSLAPEAAPAAVAEYGGG